jgi:hypothetical protein
MAFEGGETQKAAGILKKKNQMKYRKTQKEKGSRGRTTPK